MKHIISWTLVILWMILIFILSSIDGKTSTEISTNGIENILNKSVIINKENINTSELSKRINYPIRKTLHFIEYFILTLLLCNAFKNSNINNNRMFIYSLIICILYAISDEIHQMYTLRTSRVIDVLIDTCGGIFCELIIKLKMINKKC